ncbi:MAG: diaminobutyrate--2-oxoglutarate transaminase [Sandaracinaceae bacterium]|nr:diaminobutyrate--2-oxoglutarate transaminase [Sandaracinaceae bacterium]
MREIFERHESEVRGYCRTWPAVFDKAKNARQTDVDGRSYVDFFAGAGVLNFGHNPEPLKRALVEYLEADGVAHSLDTYTRAKARFIERFVTTILEPRGLDYRLQFTGPTGTNAVEAALKLARKITGRAGVVSFTNGFHGMTLGALAITGNGLHRAAAGVSLDHVTRVPFDGYLGPGVDTLAALRRQLGDPSSGLTPPAAFVVETVQAEGGVNVARPEWLRAVEALAREHGALFVVDDIQVGCGRTGRYFSFEDLGLDPDVVVLAKGIGGYGLPLAMLLIKPARDAWRPGEHTGTFRGQCLSMIAGAEALRYFEDPAFLPSVLAKGRRADEALSALVDRHESLSLRSKGMIHGIDFGDGALAARACAEAFARGLIIATCGPGGRVLKVMAPLTIEDDTLDEGLAILVDAIEATLAR